MADRPTGLMFFLTAVTTLMLTATIGGVLLLRQELHNNGGQKLDADTVEALRTLSVRLDEMDMAHREEMAAMRERLANPPAVEVIPPMVEAAPTPPEPVVQAPSEEDIRKAKEAEERAARSDAEIALLRSYLSLKQQVQSGEPYADALAAFSGAAGERFRYQREALEKTAADGVPGEAELRTEFLDTLEGVLPEEEAPPPQDALVQGDASFADRLNSRLKGFITIRPSVPKEVKETGDLRERARAASMDDYGSLIGELPKGKQAAFDDWRERLAQRRAALEAIGAIETALTDLVAE